MHVSTVPRRRAALSMTPLIDMAFLLITFFVMTLRLTASQTEKVELPRADQAQATHESQVTVVTIVVDRAGRIFANGGERELAALGDELRDRLAGGATLKVVIRADASSPFAQVRRVMRLAAESGVEKLSISALKLAEGAP